MNKVLRITLRGELQVFTDSDLDACIREANRRNTERGYRNGVCGRDGRWAAHDGRRLQGGRMSLRDQGFKFCISPDKKQGQWLHPTVF